ncbi:MAG: hypothetical protein C0490_14400 [Marivirga sp.]|nr:hypothetical protein [Marivirga sp.]
MKTLHLAIILIIGSGFTAPVNMVKLEYAFRVGDEYTLTQITKQTINQSIMGTEQNGENMYSGEMNFKVVELTPSGARLETQFIALKNRSKTMMGDVTMDSEGSEDNMQNKIFKSMMKKSFFVTLNKTGVVENVEGAENLWSGLNTLGLDENTINSTKQSLEQLLGKNSLKNSVEQAMVYYTDRKVKQGDVWTSKNGFPMDFPIQIENSWNLVNLGTTTAKVSADGVFTTTDKQKAINLPGGIKAKVDLGGKQTMQANVNLDTGWPSDLHILSELKGKMILLAGGILQEDMEMPMQILTNTSYKITKK